MRLFGILAALCGSAALQAAEVVIHGAGEPVRLHGYAELSVPVNQGDVVAWQVFPPPPQRSTFGGTLIFAARPGEAFTVGVTIVNFEAKRLDSGTATVLFAAPQPPLPPAPVPTPPTPAPNPPAPSPASVFVRASRDGLGKVVGATNAERAAVASAAETIAAAVAAGAYDSADGLDTAAVLTAWRDANRQAVNREKWSGWGQSVSVVLQAEFAAGRLATKDRWAAAFREIAQGVQP